MRAPARHAVFHPLATGAAPVIGEDTDLWISTLDLPGRLDCLLELMRRTGKPRSTPELVRLWLERLRDDAARGR